MRRWSEPDDLPLVLSQTKYNWSLAADGEDVHSATHDMEVQCGGGGQPKLVLRSPQYTCDVVVSFIGETKGETMVLAGLEPVIPNHLISPSEKCVVESS